MVLEKESDFMTVYEIIRRLAKYDPNSQVYTYDECGAFEVEGVGIDEGKIIVGLDIDLLEPKKEPYPDAECFDTGRVYTTMWFTIAKMKENLLLLLKITMMYCFMRNCRIGSKSALLWGHIIQTGQYWSIRGAKRSCTSYWKPKAM